ncbi:MAG: AraC family transcriptional regulator, partial [Clostridiales bacterium]|nr:AraC family transcriptional regulator [Clostridiales bacterium]
DSKLYPADRIIFCCHPRFKKRVDLNSPYMQMIYVYSGQCCCTIRDRTITLRQNETCIFSANIPHTFEPTGENDLLINCLITREYLDEVLLGRLSGRNALAGFLVNAVYAENDSNDYILFRSGDSGNSGKVRQLVCDVFCEFFERSVFLDEIISSYMILIFSELLRIYEKDSDERNSAILNNNKLSDIVLYVQTNCESEGLNSIAGHFHFHPNYFCTVLKKMTGRNFTDFVQEAKLKKAGMLLKNSKMPVVEIAHEVGYQNITFFYQLFNKTFGCTPSEYRKK